MLDDVDIYAPFRDNNDDGNGAVGENILANNANRSAARKPACRRSTKVDDKETLQVGLVLQTTSGLGYEIKLTCKPSSSNPKLPEPQDFAKKLTAFVKNFNVDREAIKMYNSAGGNLPLKTALDAANNIRSVLTSMKPAHFLMLLRRGLGGKR